MLKLLVAVDGSPHSDRAIEHVLRLNQESIKLELHLLNVQPPVGSGHARMFLPAGEVEAYHREEGAKALASARAKLDHAGMPYTVHITVGPAGESIARFAKEHGIDQIVMGTHGRGALASALMGSVASDIVRFSELPVTLVSIRS